MESTSDFLLVHRARAGDEEACERLVRKYYPSIYQYCLLHIYDTYEAEDLTQEVFARAFASLDRYREYGKVKNYLYTIAGNVVKNYYKKKKEQGEDVQIVELSFDEIFSYEPIPKKIFSEEELKENQKKRTVEEVRPPKKTEKPVQTEEEKLSELLESHVYNEEQLGEIMLAIGAGISYDKILQMADTKNSAEKMKEIRKKFTKETASD